MNQPLVSVITPTLNRADMIADAIESVLAQNYPNFEHLIIDGGSTDGTLDVLSKYPHLKVISEPDNGMYDAINKGIRAAQGNILSILNSDDCYPPDTFTSVEQCIHDSPNSDVVIGGALIFEEDPHVGRKILNRFAPYEAKDLFTRLIQGSAIFNAWFLKRNLIDRVGFFRTEYRIAADSEMILRIGISGFTPMLLHQVVYHYRHHSGSATFNNNVDRIIKPLTENMRICETYIDSLAIAPHIRKFVRRWHTRDTLQLAYYHLKNKRFRDFLYILKKGWLYDIWWPVAFTLRICRRIFL